MAGIPNTGSVPGLPNTGSLPGTPTVPGAPTAPGVPSPMDITALTGLVTALLTSLPSTATAQAPPMATPTVPATVPTTGAVPTAGDASTTTGIPYGTPSTIPTGAVTGTGTGTSTPYGTPYANPTPSGPHAPGAFTPETARQDFPILHRTVNGHPLVWLDNGATTQKPRQVIEALAAYYGVMNSNIHRGAHTMAREATEAYEGGRAAVADFLGAASPDSIVFVRGTTEAINLVAQTWGKANIGPGDEILVPVLEHHSNIVPWQMLAADRHARVVPVPLLPDGQIDLNAYADLLSVRTQLVALSHASNVLGTVPPVREMTALAHRYGAKVLVDGAQAVAHFPVDVQALDADFYAFSGHKLFGPTGIGALYGKPEVLATMAPWQGGGNMIESVSFDRTTYAPEPHLFEAGTGHISGVVGLLSALNWLTSFDRQAVAAYETALTQYAQQALATVPGLSILGTAPERISVLTFTLAGVDPATIADWLDRDGIAIRSGHHCAQPALNHYGLDSAARASLALYNTTQEVDMLTESLRRLQQTTG
ncbi:SufS family cysteine desulfurase [Streptomyces sp. NPDC003077]|uniref:SufS family cysteine desulfurase n=1 Tax=Streptomyces sp. NPDC003077 TaxID=3154443 RepID=UPI0033AC5881